MDKTLYDRMNWADVEEIVYSESSDPHRILGPHLTEQGLLIQAFIPTARAVAVIPEDPDMRDSDGPAPVGRGDAEPVGRFGKTGRGDAESAGRFGKAGRYPMEMADEEGFFAVLIPEKRIIGYVLEVTYDNGTVQLLHDPYAYEPRIPEEDLKKFDAGVWYHVYEKLGAHPMEIDGVCGTCFAVWAPCAMRVSVVGDFNLWDGRRHQMRRLGSHGVFELFIPGLGQGDLYKYEVKTQNRDTLLKADPYGTYAEVRPGNASVIWDVSRYSWNDGEWMRQRAGKRTEAKQEPMSVYEVHLGSWMPKPDETEALAGGNAGSEFAGYREIAVRLGAYVKEMGYTHIELMPVMEHPLDASFGYQTTGYYAPTSRYGSPDDFRYFMDYMHQQGIGVILDWTPAQFPRDLAGLAAFDGTCVYEHKDPRKGTHPAWGTLIYNYGRPQVANFLIANALYWLEVFHADGIRVDSAAAMLYLDYGRNPGEWVPNIYGGNENLEAVEFLKRLACCIHARKDGTVLIAEESAAWPKVTGDEKDGALGFDYKWNNGWMNDFLTYMRYDPYFRWQKYAELTFSMLYAYSEDFVLALPHHEMSGGRGSMFGKMPGDTPGLKMAHLRAAYGYWMTYPGKKLLFMGQDMAAETEWNGKPFPAADRRQREMQAYVKALNHLYRTQPALYRLDYQPEGFEWIDCLSSRGNMLVYLRKTEEPEDTLLVVCNFAPTAHEDYRTGVPFHGEYREIFSSNAAEFGGDGTGGRQTVVSSPEEWDGREESVVIRVAPLGVQVFECVPLKETHS